MTNVLLNDKPGVERRNEERGAHAGARGEVPARARSEERKKRETLMIVALLVLTCVCFANTLTNGFVYDDDQQILQNPYVKSWKFIPQIFTTTVWSFVGQAGATNYYRPLMTLTYLGLWSLFGDAPSGFHIFNLAMQLAVVVLVFFVGRRLLGHEWMAWIAALVFAVHPVHTEVVDWIASVPDLETTFFSLLLLWLIADFEMADWVAGALGALALLGALFAKEPSLLVAPLALVFGYLLSGKAGANGDEAVGGGQGATSSVPFAHRVARWLPILLMGAAYVAWRILLFGKLAPVLQHAQITWPQAVYSACALVLTYARLLVWPARLSAFHVFHASHSPWEPQVLGGVVIIAGFLAGAVVAWRKRVPEASFCVVWMALTLLPVLNARWMAANVLTERYLYLPSVGFCWLIGWGAVRLWKRAASWGTVGLASRSIVTWGGCGMLAACAFLVVQRNRVWHDDLSLYTQTLVTDPDAAIIRNNLAGAYLAVGNLDRAETEWLAALAGKPDNVITMNALGVLYTREKKYDAAEKYLLMAIHTRPEWADGHYDYAIVLGRVGKDAESKAEFQRAIALAPFNPTARLWYGKTLLTDREFAEAEAQFRRSYELQPSDEALRGLADVYLQTGQSEKAQGALGEFLSHSPYDSEAHLQLAKLLEAAGENAKAMAEYRAVLVTDPRNMEAIAALKKNQ
jgi:protein O-mannosyl-transferase